MIHSAKKLKSLMKKHKTLKLLQQGRRSQKSQLHLLKLFYLRKDDFSRIFNKNAKS